MTQSNSLKDLIGDKFVGKNNKKIVSKSFDEVVGDSDLVGLYFSAHWCGPCRRFTPILSECYNTWKKSNEKIVIIFGSGDKSEEKFTEYVEFKYLVPKFIFFFFCFLVPKNVDVFMYFVINFVYFFYIFSIMTWQIGTL